jgi:hypothetical protein
LALCDSLSAIGKIRHVADARCLLGEHNARRWKKVLPRVVMCAELGIGKE